MIDLHAHTTISDGSYSPAELIKQAKINGLNAVAITDHDSVEGHEEAAVQAALSGILLIKGIEFDVYFMDRRLHILGFNIDSTREGFLTIYNAFKKRKEECLLNVFEQLKKTGVCICAEDILPYQTGAYLDRQAIAKYLVAKGYTDNMKESWGNYLDRIAFLEGELLDAASALSAIHLAGGKAFLAHFHLPIGLSGTTEIQAKSILHELKKLGLDGMEYYYPSYTGKDKEQCKRFIETFGFLKSGGTDFHGSNRPHIQLGIGEGDFSVPDEILAEIMM